MWNYFSRVNFFFGRSRMSLPPWALLRNKQQTVPTETTDIESTIDWSIPPYLNLEKHARYYRDLMKSTEKVELSLAHSGKAEVYDSFEDPADPSTKYVTEKAHTILVPVRSEFDPRSKFIGESSSSRCVGTYPEYSDPVHLQDLLVRRATAQTHPSRTPTPTGSPSHTPLVAPVKPPPPTGGPPVKPPPPPPKAPEKKARIAD